MLAGQRGGRLIPIIVVVVHDEAPFCQVRPPGSRLGDGKIIRAVLDGLGQMRERDGLRPVEIGDRARDAQDAVIAAGGERHGVKRLVHELLALGRERAELRKGARSHVRIGRGGVVPVARALHGAGGVDTRADGLRRS